MTILPYIFLVGLNTSPSLLQGVWAFPFDFIVLKAKKINYLQNFYAYFQKMPMTKGV
jgi:hypothetical protein